MIITLWGPDSYRRLKKLEEVLTEYRKKYSGFSHERFDLAEDGELLRFRDFVSTRSMFDPVRLAVLDNVLGNPEQKDLKKILKDNSETKDITLVINLDKKPPVAYKFLLEKPAQNQEFPALEGEKLLGFIKSIASELKLKIDISTVNGLADTFGSDTWGIVTELERIALSADQTHASEYIPNYLAVMNALKRGRSVRERLSALEALLEVRGDDPARVFNGLAFRPRSAEEVQKFANYDVAVKSGKLEYEEVLLDLALGG